MLLCASCRPGNHPFGTLFWTKGHFVMLLWQAFRTLRNKVDRELKLGF
jgi:hypothetical protein